MSQGKPLSRSIPLLIAVLLLLVWTGLTAQQRKPSETEDELQSVLSALDKTAQEFQTMKGDIKVTNVILVVDDKTEESGEIFFKKTRSGSKIKIHFKKPTPKEILIADGKVILYFPKINKIDQFVLGSDAARDKVELSLLAGFGSSGASLKKNFNIRLMGHEKTQGRHAVKLELTPKSREVRAQFVKQEAWFDEENWVPIQQKLIEADGNFHLIQLNDVKLNKGISDSVFQIKSVIKANK